MCRIFILLLAGLLAFSFNAHAKVDFSGKTITWVVPFKEVVVQVDFLGLLSHF